MIQSTRSVRNLNVQLQSDLVMNDQVSAVVRSCNNNVKQLRAVRSIISRDALRHAAYVIMLSTLDYCNSLYVNVSVTQ